MSIVRLPSKTCDHHQLIAAIVESSLADAEECVVKVQFQPDTFMTTSALAQLCSWGLLRKTRGCSFRFLGEKRALAYPSRIDLFKHLEFEYQETFERHDESGRFIPLRLLTDRGASLADAVEAALWRIAIVLSDRPPRVWRIAIVLSDRSERLWSLSSHGPGRLGRYSSCSKSVPTRTTQESSCSKVLLARTARRSRPAKDQLFPTRCRWSPPKALLGRARQPSTPSTDLP